MPSANSYCSVQYTSLPIVVEYLYTNCFIGKYPLAQLRLIEPVFFRVSYLSSFFPKKSLEFILVNHPPVNEMILLMMLEIITMLMVMEMTVIRTIVMMVTMI